MAKAYVILTDGFEETEAVCTVDLLRRGGVDAVTLSLGGAPFVSGAHGVRLEADAAFSDISDGDMLVLPGGPGTPAYAQNEKLVENVRAYADAGKWVAAICAAPTALYEMGVLNGRRFTCYPGMGGALTGAALTEGDVVTDGRFITSKGPGTSAAFGLALVSALMGDEAAQSVRERFCV